jgi:hypothetical protein
MAERERLKSPDRFQSTVFKTHLRTNPYNWILLCSTTLPMENSNLMLAIPGALEQADI